MGIEQSMRRGLTRVDPIPLPWVCFPTDLASLSGIILTLDVMPLGGMIDPLERRFWDSLRDHCIGMARRQLRLEAADATAASVTRLRVGT